MQGLCTKILVVLVLCNKMFCGIFGWFFYWNEPKLLKNYSVVQLSCPTNSEATWTKKVQNATNTFWVFDLLTCRFYHKSRILEGKGWCLDWWLLQGESGMFGRIGKIIKVENYVPENVLLIFRQIFTTDVTLFPT